MNTVDDRSFNDAFVTDIAASHLETLFGQGTPTLGALTDLLEFSQAALLHEHVTVSPTAHRHSTFVRAFPWVTAPEIRIVDAKADAPADESKGVLVIDADVEGPFGHDPSAEMVLAMAFSEAMQDNDALGPMINPERMDPSRDRGLFFRSKLPLMMFLLQARRGLIEFEDEAAREGLMEVLNPIVYGYRMFARPLRKLQYTWNVDVVASVLEQPLLSTFLVDEATEPFEDSAGARALSERFNKAALGAAGRAGFFEKWQFPPLGLLALAEASSLEDVAKQITEARDKFAPLRAAVTSHARRRLQLIREAEGFSAGADAAAAELDRLDAELREAYDAFDAEVAMRRKRFQRTELIFNTLDYALTVAAGWGLGSIGAVVEKFGLKRRAMLQRVPGLFKAASFITGRDSAAASAVIEKLLRRPTEDFGREAGLLGLAFDHATVYGETPRDTEPPHLEAVTITDEEGNQTRDTDRTFWLRMLQDEPYRTLILPAP